MRFAIIAPEVPTQRWKKELEVLAPEIPIVIGSETAYADEVVCAMVWKQARGALLPFKNLKLIFSMGAGVDHVLADDTIPKHLPICRVIDPQMAFSMSNYLLMAVMNHHRSFYDYQSAQQKKHWAQFEFPEKQLKIGVLGTGFLGMDIALKLHHLGFAVSGYSTRPKVTPFPSYAGEDLPDFLATLNVLICLVPFTPQTEGLLNYSLFKKFKEPTYLINVSRGAVHVEQDLIRALDEGLLNGVFLDVFEKEPLPKTSPLWSHPKVQLTPHIASLTYARESVLQMLDCFERVEKGLPLPQQVDRERRY